MPVNLIDPESISPYLAQFCEEDSRALACLEACCTQSIKARAQSARGIYELPPNAPAWLQNKWDITAGGYGSLNLTVCTKTTKLPRNLKVMGNLDLYYCENLKSLCEEKLEVWGNLIIHGCPKIKSIPVNTQVDHQIYSKLGDFNTVQEARDTFDRHYGRMSKPVPPTVSYPRPTTA